MIQPGSDVLAYTPTYGDRLNLLATVPDLRGSAGYWFDWAVWAGDPSPELRTVLDKQLEDPAQTGIQYLQCWNENRGQHYATTEALALARTQGYKWLLRLDDDVLHKTKRWLKKILERTQELRRLAKDNQYRIVVGPRIVGLNTPPKVEGQIQVGQSFQANIVEALGGACRLHPIELLEGYAPNLYLPTGRGDPQGIGAHVDSKDGLLVQYPDIRMIHRTNQLEEEDSPSMQHRRRMSHYWPWLGSEAEPREEAE